MPWFHLSHVLAAGTGQFTTPSWPLWMFSFENYADQSLYRRQKLIGMRLGMRFFIYGMNGSEILLQMHTFNTWSYITCKNHWNLARHVAALPAHRWVQRLLSWHPIGTRRVGRPRHTWESRLHAYCRYASLESWREVDDVFYLHLSISAACK